MRKTIAWILVLALTALFCCSCADTTETYGKEFTPELSIDTTGHTIHHAEITVKGYGIITVALDETVAPITVQNFIKLAKEGFYDGLTFHRIISGFMIQGGDPNGDGTGGSPDTITGEFSDNGIENDLSHTRGILSMARLGESSLVSAEEAMNSASSQFFIMHADSTGLDGKYAAFGWVTSGMEFVDAICEDVQSGTNGAVDKADQPVIVSIRIVEE